MNSIDWEPGRHAKGIVDEWGDVHVWDEDEYPYHSDYIEAHPEVGDPQGFFYVSETGGIDITYPNPNYDDPDLVNSVLAKIIRADPHFFKDSKDFA